MLSVLLAHWTPTGTILHAVFNGKAGYTLFFVLSGYLISRILFNERIKETPISKALSLFYARRTLRIFPIYYLTLFVVWTFGLIPSNIWSYIMYFQNIQFAINDSFDGVNSHLWSLAVEEQFYLVWPFMMLLTPKQHLLKAIVISAAIGPLSRLVGIEWFGAIGKNIEMIQLLTPTTLDCFGMGALLAYFETYRFDSYLKFVRSLGPLLIGITGVLLYLVFRHFREGILDDLFHRTVISLWCIYLIPLNFRINTSRYSQTLVFKAFLHIGKVSYGMYLFHNYVKVWFDWFRAYLIQNLNSETLVAMINATTENKIQFVLLTILTIMLSSFSWWLIESPMNRLKRYFPYS